jgi:co-chaperonin GroES (HSP10)
MPNRVIVAVDKDERDMYDIVTPGGLLLTMRKKYGFDGKVCNPSMGYVLLTHKDETQFKKGDTILCSHIAFIRDSGGYSYGQIPVDHDGLSVYSLETNTNLIYLKIDYEGNPYPLSGFLTVERIPIIHDTTLLIPDSAAKTEPMKFKVLQAGEECGDLKSGDIILAEKYGDVEVNYIFNKTERMVIRMRYSDVIGKFES